MSQTFQVVDLFAGPGGLAEGFSACRDGEHQPFNVVLSVEKEPSAHKTLRLRAFLRQFDEGFPPEYYAFLNGGGEEEPDWASLYPEEWKNANEEAQRLELGTDFAAKVLERRLKELRASGAETIVIGGPPCQAYSLVGRARNQGIAGYVAEEDKRHFLYGEYIKILSALRPAAFVMENVKGMLSSSVDGGRIFDRVLADLQRAGGVDGSYRLFAISRRSDGGMVLRPAEKHTDYVVHAEKFGVPQARHRVIIVGLRSDLAYEPPIEARNASGSVSRTSFARHVLAGMPKLRSALSRRDNPSEWRNTVLEQMAKVVSALRDGDELLAATVAPAAEKALKAFKASNDVAPRHDTSASPLPKDCPEDLASWLSDPLLKTTPNHASRGHMADDLGRYFFSAVFAEAVGRAPKADEFPDELAPAHANWTSGKFADRFRAQLWGSPSTTVTSHIAKDGHYFIHPDPKQCRALTVREAARLQTFPDNYLFLGNRTEQYVQVGNAVPPFLAAQIAATVWGVLQAARESRAHNERSAARG